MTQVVAGQNESFESLWRRFKKAVERENILSDLRKHEYYEKPGIKRKKKSLEARKREAKNKKREAINRSINFKFNFDKTKKIYQNKPRNPMRRS